MKSDDSVSLRFECHVDINHSHTTGGLRSGWDRGPGYARKGFPRMKLLHKRAMAALSAVTVAAVLVAGCSSPAKPAPPPPPAGLLRLGYTATLADAPVLAGLRLGYFATSLGGVTLQAVPFPSTAAEA